MARRGLEERARVPEGHLDPRVVVGVLEVELAPEREDRGIDLDGVHLALRAAERRAHVVSGARSDDEDRPRRKLGLARVRRVVELAPRAEEGVLLRTTGVGAGASGGSRC